MTQSCSEIDRATARRCCRSLERRLDPELFKALGEPTRLALLVTLAGCRRPVTVSEVATCCTIDLSVVSRHLRALRDAGALHAEKRGKEVLYTVNYRQLSKQLRAIADAIDACCPPGCC